MTIHCQATSIHTGTFPAADSSPRRTSWRKRADSIYLNVQRRLSSKSISSEDHTQIKEVIHSLTSKERDTAARTNYSYMVNPDDEALRDQSIYAAVSRVFRSKDGSATRTLDALRKTLAFRQAIGIDDLRSTFSRGKDAQQEALYEHLSQGMVYVQGYDKQGRSTYIFEPHRVTNSSEELEWTIRMHVYNLERAIACTKCPDKTVNAVVNFQNFSIRKHKPPMELGIEFMQTLRYHYSGHVNQIYLVDAPRTFLYLWAIFVPFLAAKTKKKIHFVSGARQKTNLLGELYDKDQAPSWLLPEGTLNRAFEPKAYMLETPFDKAFNEDVPPSAVE